MELDDELVKLGRSPETSPQNLTLLDRRHREAAKRLAVAIQYLLVTHLLTLESGSQLMSCQHAFTEASTYLNLCN